MMLSLNDPCDDDDDVDGDDVDGDDVYDDYDGGCENVYDDKSTMVIHRGKVADH